MWRPEDDGADSHVKFEIVGRGKRAWRIEKSPKRSCDIHSGKSYTTRSKMIPSPGSYFRRPVCTARVSCLVLTDRPDAKRNGYGQRSASGKLSDQRPNINALELKRVREYYFVYVAD